MPVVEDILWKHPGHPGMIVITAHATIDQRGRLVMHHGPAKEASRRIPGIEAQCAEKILSTAVDGIYGFLPVRPPRPEEKIIGFGLFQTQHTLDDEADPEMIHMSLERMKSYLSEFPRLKVRMNYPGLAEGLPVEDVAPILTALPASVTLCHNGEVPPQIQIGYTGAKDLFLMVERWLGEGRFNYAVDYLIENGYDRATAVEQVSAVKRTLQEQAEQDAIRYRQRNPGRWEQNQLRL
jgi:hypothetical protein